MEAWKVKIESLFFLLLPFHHPLHMGSLEILLTLAHTGGLRCTQLWNLLSLLEYW